MGRPTVVKIGDAFGYLTVIARTPSKFVKQARWLCRCTCGVQKEFYTTHLRSKNTKSCGCRFRAMQREAKVTHGLSGSPTHTTWTLMKQRCLNPNAPDYDKYGGRGITVCERWLSFANFFADVGERPQGKTLDRVNNDVGYEPGNCRWATLVEQQANRRNTKTLTYKGETLPVSEWARRANMPNNRLHMRLRNGWSPDRALGGKI